MSEREFSMSESGQEISETVESTSIDDDRAGKLTISRTAVNMAQGGTEFGTPTRFTCKMRQWNWLFVNT
jgi:hypothetical protein